MDTIFKDIVLDAVRDLRVAMNNPPSDPVQRDALLKKVQERQRGYDEMGAVVVKNYQQVQDVKNDPRYKALLAASPMLVKNEGPLRKLFQKLTIENGKVVKGTLNSKIVEKSNPKTFLSTWNKLLEGGPPKKKAKPVAAAAPPPPKEKEEAVVPPFDAKAFRKESKNIYKISKDHGDNKEWQDLYQVIEDWKGAKSGDKWNKAFASYRKLSDKLLKECAAAAVEQPKKTKLFDEVFKEQVQEDDDEEEVVDSDDEKEDDSDDDKDEPNESFVVSDDDEEEEEVREVERKKAAPAAAAAVPKDDGFMSFCSEFLKTMRGIYDNGHATQFLQSFQPSYQIEIVEDGKVLPGSYKGYASAADAKAAGERLLKLLVTPSRYTYKVTQQ